MHGGDGAPAREGAALEGTGGAFKNASQLSALYSQYYAVRLSPTYTRPVHVYGTQGLCTCTVLKACARVRYSRPVHVYGTQGSELGARGVCLSD
jgi:hypothetical protein